MSTEITIRKANSTWVVRAGGAVIGESNKALILEEGSLDPVVYFPSEDLAMAFLEPSATKTTCPHKGEASYYSIQTKSVLIEDAAWSYETPLADVAEITGHIAFYPNKAAVERL